MILNAVYYIIVFVVIGVPIWCLTTTTYRASLPFDKIDEINSMEKFEIGIKLNLVHFDTKLNENKLKTDLEQAINNDMPIIGLTFNFEANIRKADSNELNLAEKSNKIEGFN